MQREYGALFATTPHGVSGYVRVKACTVANTGMSAPASGSEGRFLPPSPSPVCWDQPHGWMGSQTPSRGSAARKSLWGRRLRCERSSPSKRAGSSLSGGDQLVDRAFGSSQMGIRARLLPRCRPSRGLSALEACLIGVSTPLSGLLLGQAKARPYVGTDATGGGRGVVERCFEWWPCGRKGTRRGPTWAAPWPRMLTQVPPPFPFGHADHPIPGWPATAAW